MALGASDAPNATLGASSAPNATLGAFTGPALLRHPGGGRATPASLTPRAAGLGPGAASAARSARNATPSASA
ncbi:hypothetical protein EIY87_27205 [Amycolatopsis eburnea]|uniref:Uncharacterized protein n=1 Tax=Amycolatopsis eburnea TaxID=2267691 RepID=A0A427T3C9_9PSEU|nr:hypothetical protein EIY87_27205 [Amycolatopsis eburnea]